IRFTLPMAPVAPDPSLAATDAPAPLDPAPAVDVPVVAAAPVVEVPTVAAAPVGEQAPVDEPAPVDEGAPVDEPAAADVNG
ncbi:MAG TPA: hypothetical protein VGF84_16800, partial [Micromonosporaceae bacterium]